MRGSERLAPELNMRNPLYAGKEAHKGIYPAFEPESRRHQKSKTGVPVVPTKRTDLKHASHVH